MFDNLVRASSIVINHARPMAPLHPHPKKCLAFLAGNLHDLHRSCQRSRALLTYVISGDNLRKGYLCRAGGCSSIVAFDRICLRARRGCCSAAARSFAVGFS
jgi:hypothetical protein